MDDRVVSGGNGKADGSEDRAKMAVRENWKMCDCAGCGVEMFGVSMRNWYRGLSEYARRELPPMVAGRIYDRPYCLRCFALKTRNETRVFGRG